MTIRQTLIRHKIYLLLTIFLCMSQAGCAAKATTAKPIWQITAGATQLPVLNWQQRSDWINVKTDVSPAAVGDGVQDDTAALQAALNRLADTVGAPHVVYLPPGTYRITSTLTLTKIMGVLIVGHGRSTRIVWDGAQDGVMYDSNGVSRSRYVGLIWDGAGKAAVGIDHHSQTYYETRVRHQDEAFLNFTQAGIRAGNDQTIPSAEIMFRNCLFQHCDSGVAFLAWNDYDNDFDGCVFQGCGTAINCQKGNVYVRDCHFEGSSQADLTLCSQAHSIRRCTSFHSSQFITTLKEHATLELMVEDCRVDGWTSHDGAVTLAMRGPTTLFDCAFTNPPDNSPPIRLTNPPNALQTLAISDVSSTGADHLVDKGPNSDIVQIPEGSRAGCLVSSSAQFFAQSETVPGKVFDAKRDFGAKGDGHADDTQAVLSAVQAARSAGNGAIAYLPAGNYVVTRTIPITGSGYTVGGSGFATLVHWRGADDGVVFAVRDPQNVTLEQMQILASAESVCRVQQTSAGGPSSVVYDGIYVKSSFLGPTSRGGRNGHIEPGHEARALECVNLPADAVVHIKHFDGTVRLVNCGRAAILADFTVDGALHLLGTAPDTGFLGFQSRSTAGNPCDLVVENNQSLVMGDFYSESTQKHILMTGSADPSVPPGHVTIHGIKVHTYDPEAITLNNYRGRFAYIGGLFAASTYNIVHTGTAPVRIVLMSNTFWKGKPQIQTDQGAKVTRIHNLVSGQDVSNLTEHLENVATPAEQPAASDGAAPGVATALDDFRTLGVWDLKLNHPHL